MLAREREIIITRNGREVACLSPINNSKKQSGYVAEGALSGGYGLRKATYEEFLELTEDTEKRYEYIDGEVFLLASPKTDHQVVLTELLVAFYASFEGTHCIPIVAPYDITIRRSPDNINIVQPDLVVICDLGEQLGEDGYYQGVPVLVVEILSENTRKHDFIKKLNLYLDGGVKEYWIVDPKNKQIVVYTFTEQDIDEYLTFKTPERARSVVFDNLVVDLPRIFRAV